MRSWSGLPSRGTSWKRSEQMENAKLDPVCYADFPTERDLSAARDRLRNL